MVNRRDIKKMAQDFLRDESGQSATEYVLLLLFVVIAVQNVGKVLKTRLKGVIEAAFGKIDTEIENSN